MTPRKRTLVDNAAIGINDNPVVGQESIDCVRVIVGDRSREFVFQFQQFFLHRMFKEQSISLTRYRRKFAIKGEHFSHNIAGTTHYGAPRAPLST